MLHRMAAVLIFAFMACPAFGEDCLQDFDKESPDLGDLRKEGSGAGNGFKHLVNYAYDFHIAYPPKWRCARTYSSGWQLSNKDTVQDPDRQSGVEVRFEGEFPAAGIEDMLPVIQQRHPDLQVEWQRLAEEPFVGWTTGDLPHPSIPDRSEAYTYYLGRINPDGETSTSYFIHRTEDITGSGRYDVRNIIRTIDRASAAPEIIGIVMKRGADGEVIDKFSANESFVVGEEACYLFELNDLKGSFHDGSVREFLIKGMLPHWSEHRTQWLAKTNQMQICVTITSNFGSNGLQMKKLSISNGRHNLDCFGADRRLICHPEDGDGEVRFEVAYPTVDNPRPDRSGPAIASFTLDRDRYTLTLAATDPSTIYSGEIFLSNGRSRLLFADDFQNGIASLEIADAARRGWNTIESLRLYDTNGYYTEWSHLDCDDRESEYYFARAYDQSCEKTSQKVLHFLKP